MEQIEFSKPGQIPRYKRLMYVDPSRADSLLFAKMAEEENASRELILTDSINEAKELVTMLVPENFPSFIYCDMMMKNNHAKVFEFIMHLLLHARRESQRKTRIVVFSACSNMSSENREELDGMLNAGLIYRYVKKPLSKALFDIVANADCKDDVFAYNSFPFPGSLFPTYRPRYYRSGAWDMGYFIPNSDHYRLNRDNKQRVTN